MVSTEESLQHKAVFVLLYKWNIKRWYASLRRLLNNKRLSITVRCKHWSVGASGLVFGQIWRTSLQGILMIAVPLYILSTICRLNGSSLDSMDVEILKLNLFSKVCVIFGTTKWKNIQQIQIVQITLV